MSQRRYQKIVLLNEIKTQYSKTSLIQKKAILQGKFVALKASNKNSDKTPINDLKIQLKNLGNKNK